MEALCELFRQRMPFISKWQFAGQHTLSSEAVPRCLELMLHAVPRRGEGPRCFVLPRRQSVAPLLAVLYALCQFKDDFETLAAEYAEKQFQIGQRVLVRPTGRIYTFEGFVEGSDRKQFKLGVPNQTGAVLTPAIGDVLRIEPTTSQLPRGRLSWADFPPLAPSALDSLLNIATCGNRSLFKNKVIYLDHRSALEEILSKVALHCSEPDSSSPTLDALIPFGSVIDDGTLIRWDNEAASGQPLVAVSSQVASIATVCETAPQDSKLVVINGLRLVSRDLQAFDTVCATQNVVLIADEQEQDGLDVLATRGCKFWWLAPEDISDGSKLPEPTEHNDPPSLFGPLHTAACNAASVLEIDCIRCEEPELEKAALLLEKLAAAQGNENEDEGHDGLQELLKKFYGLLILLSSALKPLCVAADAQVRISQLHEELHRREWFLDRTSLAELRQVLACLEKICTPNEQLGLVKFTALTELFSRLRSEGYKRIGVLTRGDESTSKILDTFGEPSINLEVISARAIDEKKFYDVIICTFWPNGQRFSRLARLHLAPKIFVVGYAYEQRWLKGCWRRLKQRPATNLIGHQEKARWLNWNGPVPSHWQTPFGVPAVEVQNPTEECEGKATSEFDVERFEGRLHRVQRRIAPMTLGLQEESVSARLVEFCGGAYSWITLTRRLPVVTEILNRSTPAFAMRGIPMRKIEELLPNDYVVFRDGGRRDVIEALADSLLGEKAPLLRAQTILWRRALATSGLSIAELRQLLASEGVTKNLSTLRDWLDENSQRIGPRSHDDFVAIARATRDGTLSANLEETWAAIGTVRGAHISAGSRLTTALLEQIPQRLDTVSEGGTHFEIGGDVSAWVVQVKTIGDETQPCPRSTVNRLLRDPMREEDSLFA